MNGYTWPADTRSGLARVARTVLRKAEQNIAERRADLAQRSKNLPNHYVMVSDISSEIGFEIKDGRVLRALRLEKDGELGELPQFDSDGVRFVREVHDDTVAGAS